MRTARAFKGPRGRLGEVIGPHGFDTVSGTELHKRGTRPPIAPAEGTAAVEMGEADPFAPEARGEIASLADISTGWRMGPLQEGHVSLQAIFPEDSGRVRADKPDSEIFGEGIDQLPHENADSPVFVQGILKAKR